MTEQQVLESCSDEELVLRSRGGDPGAADFLMERYKGLVRAEASPLYLKGADREDLIQEGMLGLFKALRDYDAGKGASFKTFAALCIRRNLYSAVEAAARHMHEPLNSALSFDEAAGDSGKNARMDRQRTPGDEEKAAKTLLDSIPSPDNDPESSYISGESGEELLRGIYGSLSPFEKMVFDLALAGLTTREIAVRLGREPKSVDNARQRIRTKAMAIRTSSRC